MAARRNCPELRRGQKHTEEKNLRNPEDFEVVRNLPEWIGLPRAGAAGGRGAARRACWGRRGAAVRPAHTARIGQESARDLRPLRLRGLHAGLSNLRHRSARNAPQVVARQVLAGLKEEEEEEEKEKVLLLFYFGVSKKKKKRNETKLKISAAKKHMTVCVCLGLRSFVFTAMAASRHQRPHSYRVTIFRVHSFYHCFPSFA